MLLSFMKVSFSLQPVPPHPTPPHLPSLSTLPFSLRPLFIHAGNLKYLLNILRCLRSIGGSQIIYFCTQHLLFGVRAKCIHASRLHTEILHQRSHNKTPLLFLNKQSRGTHCDYSQRAGIPNSDSGFWRFTCLMTTASISV